LVELFSYTLKLKMNFRIPGIYELLKPTNQTISQKIIGMTRI